MQPVANAENAAHIFRSNWPAVIAVLFSSQLLAACADKNWARSHINTAAWTQTSEEYRALALGAHSQAQRMLDVALADPNWTAIPGQKLTGADGSPLPPAIILDIDETVLQNVKYQSWLVKSNNLYTIPTWNKWVSEMKATAVPGAVNLVRYARDRGVKVFYVTNRDFIGPIEPDVAAMPLKEFTVQNLKTSGLLPANGTGPDTCVIGAERLTHDDSVLMRRERPEWGSDKTLRRNLIANCYRVALLVGDVLGDFIGYEKNGKHLDFYKEQDTGLDSDMRRKELEAYDRHWGQRWIILPNPAYGSWERTLYSFEYVLPPKEKERYKLDTLTAWSDSKNIRPDCHAIYDAGSTGTRLFIYYKKNGSWTEVEGPEVDKTLADGLTDDTIVPAVIKMLDDFKTFDWANQCNRISSIQVLATAGMRLQENKDPVSSKELWDKLHAGLHEAYKKYVTLSDITVKTITGYEEGIYAWLAVRNSYEQHQLSGFDFGVAEMGGGSSQVTFPCGNVCANARKFVIDNHTVPFSIHSFLGLGTDQLPDSIGFNAVPAKCAYGFGANFDEQACSDQISNLLLNKFNAIRDPIRRSFITSPDRSHLANWYLTGSFYYMDKELTGGKQSDVSNCCENKLGKYDGCFDLQKSCFVTMYRPVFLEALSIDHADAAKVSKVQTSWTMGAAVCKDTNCLQKITTRECPWLTASMCLAPPARPNSAP